MTELPTFPAFRLTSMSSTERTEKVAAEEPLELRLCLPDGPLTLAVLMRTPGDDAALLRGWLVSEGVLPESFDLLPDEENANLWHLHTPESEKVAGAARLAAEDVGRHNAVDKVVGTLFGSLPLSNHILCVSSRAGFEIVQKAISAGIAVVVSVGAPTSLAIDTAQVFGVTLCAFTREGRTTVYSSVERLRGWAKGGVADQDDDRERP